ncbi:MFS transporter [Nibricoccus aquaticus]|uniref:MFS transporter n=1 Tax=Nibricoccus aquaticus TaxID=2576891 RepID=UPI001586852B|nr:glycoside-pentoside-hexuronide (GPH):cation symporter [Nibricoccus aquaticus]
MSTPTGKTSLTTRFSYALPDIGGQLLFGWIMGYLPYFYTDVYGISAAAVAWIALIARWVDALDAPIWGIIFDKTRSRFGKSRPWFLWLCGPFAIFGTLTFLTPDLGATAKLFYAAITYIIFNVIYTGINTPVTSILSALTTDSKERVTLTTFRMFGSKLGVLIVNLTGIEFAVWLGGGDDRKGFLLAMPMFAVASIILFLIAFRNLKETVAVETKPQPILGTFGALRGNWPWVIIFISSFLFWIGFISRVSVAPHFFEYVLHRKDLIKLANSLDFASLATAVLLPWFCRKASKGTVWALGLLGMTIGQLIVYLGVKNGLSVEIILTGWTIGFLASGVAMAMPFVVLSDSVDFGEWKTGIRAAGLLTAIGAAFCLKAGAGLGTALPMWILDAAGYVAKTEPTAAVVSAINAGIVWIPAACFGLAIVPVLFYGRFEKLEPQIRADLERRRAAQRT